MNFFILQRKNFAERQVKDKVNRLLFAVRHFLPRQGGQIVLILVLVTVVGLTVGLSLISRTITDVRISSQIEQSNRAFSAAEAGVESALRGAVVGGPTGTVSLPGASAQYSVSSIGGSQDILYFPQTDVNGFQVVWLIDHNPDAITLNESVTSYPPTSSLDLCFGSGTAGFPAIGVTLVYKEGNEYKLAKGAYDSTTRDNNFSLADTAGGYCESNFRFKKTITPVSDFGIASSAKLLFLSLTVFYESTALAVKPFATLPVQGKMITSIGTTATGVARKIRVIQGYPVLPSLFNFTLFSEN